MSKISKKRLIIAILCILLAAIICFIIAPISVNNSTEKVSVISAKTHIPKDTVITGDMLISIDISKDSIPSSIILDADEVVGKYAKTDIYVSDFLASEKVTDKQADYNGAFTELDGTNCAISISIKSFATGLSNKLRTGDIISLIAASSENIAAEIPPELTYLKVLSVTDNTGRENTEIISSDESTTNNAATVTLLVSPQQARLLAELEQTSILHATLVMRGDSEQIFPLLKKQTEILEKISETEQLHTADNIIEQEAQ